MSIQVQTKRGVLANRPALVAGEFYWATDTSQLFVGPTPTKIVPVIASVDLTGQSAAKPTTLLFTPAVTGFFNIAVALKVTTPAGTSCTLAGASGVVVTYTDGDGSVAMTQVLAMMGAGGAMLINNSTNNTLNQINGNMCIFAKAGVAVNYAIGYTSAGTAMQYSAHIRVKAL